MCFIRKMTISNATTEPHQCSLNPPDISSLLGKNEAFQPSEEQENATLEASREYWYHVASIAYSSLDHGLAPEFTNPQRSLHKVPKFPGGLKSLFSTLYSYCPHDSLCYEASSTWKLGDSNCDAAKKEITRPVKMQIGVLHPTPFDFGGKVFIDWPGTTLEKETGCNYLGVLAIGWCYILSAQLIERQGGGVSMHYTESCADLMNEIAKALPDKAHVVDVGDANNRVVRWWSAILAKDIGWKATLTDKFVAPWMISRTCETWFLIKKKEDSLELGSMPIFSHYQMPLSSDDAFDALVGFASLHNLGSQVPIALAAALSFPMHQYYYGGHVKLPPPIPHGARTPKIPLDSLPAWKELAKDLPYYMTLSCTPDMLISTLCGSFWQPEVPSNMATQWLHPVLEEVLGATLDGKAQELLVLIGAIRQPNLGALWIGAAVTGMAPRILKDIKKSNPPLNSVAFPWTGVPQSFIDCAGSGPYTWNSVESKDFKYISRRDVWRLLSLSPTEDDGLNYNFGQMSPWEPFGTSLNKDCALRVASHFNCTRHAYQYDYITWELQNGESVRDLGFLNESPSISRERPNISYSKCNRHVFENKELDPYRSTSKMTSLHLFRWFVLGDEGVPQEAIYRDKNLREMLEDLSEDAYEDEELDQSEREDSQEPPIIRKERLKNWLDTID